MRASETPEILMMKPMDVDLDQSNTRVGVQIVSESGKLERSGSVVGVTGRFPTSIYRSFVPGPVVRPGTSGSQL